MRLHTLQDVGPSTMFREGLLCQPKGETIVPTVNYGSEKDNIWIGPFYSRYYHEVYPEGLHRDVGIREFEMRVWTYLRDSPIYFLEIPFSEVEFMMENNFPTEVLLVRSNDLIVIAKPTDSECEWLKGSMGGDPVDEGELNVQIGFLKIKDGILQIVAEKEMEDEPRRI